MPLRFEAVLASLVIGQAHVCSNCGEKVRVYPSCTAHLSGYVSMVPAMAPDVGGAQLQLLLQLFAQLLGGRLQQVLLLGELATRKRQGAAR